MKGKSESTKQIIVENTESPKIRLSGRNSTKIREHEINLEVLKTLQPDEKTPLETNQKQIVLNENNLQDSNFSSEKLKYRNRSLTTKGVENFIKFPDRTEEKFSLDARQVLEQKRKTMFNIKRTYSDVTHSVFQSPGSSSLKLEESHQGQSNEIKDKKVEYCDICFQDIKLKFTLSCGDFFCKECITQHVLNCMNNVISFRNMRCPKTICNEKIKDVFIEKLVSQSDYEKFTKIKQKIEGLYNPLNFPCPIPNCDSYGARGDIKNANLECLRKHNFCVKCLKESHRKRPCHLEPEESDKVLNDDRLIKKCPNCQSWVEKYQQTGCNNVTCANNWCSLTFCWVCMNAFDKNHYNNPLSICFGMQEVKTDSHFAKHKCLRVFKCMLLFLLIVFVVLPIVILLFSMVVFTFYILAFVLDGSAVKNLKLKTERRHKIFRFLIYSTYVVISLPSLPLGYWTLTALFVSSPFLYIYKKCSRQNDDDEPAPE